MMDEENNMGNRSQSSGCTKCGKGECTGNKKKEKEMLRNGKITYKKFYLALLMVFTQDSHQFPRNSFMFNEHAHFGGKSHYMEIA